MDRNHILFQDTLHSDEESGSISHIDVLGDGERWRARDISYWAGTWDALRPLIPNFHTSEFKAESSSPANPHLRSVIRQPRNRIEQPIPVGVVSTSYTLAQHVDVAEYIFEGIRAEYAKTAELRCELGLTELGEWMNLRVYFPKEFSHTLADGHEIDLKVDCFNSVDGSSRLIVIFGWLRLVCSNGLVIGETKVELRDIHNESLNIGKIPKLVANAMKRVKNDLLRLRGWENAPVEIDSVATWVNKCVAEKWGKKAACRTYHICDSGYDVEMVDPFAPGKATEKPTKQVLRVPGAPARAKNLYDVSQALSWVATRRNNPEERFNWQTQIPELVAALQAV